MRRRIGVLSLGALLAVGVVAAAASGVASAKAKSTTPVVRSVSPENGPLGGGTLVTITGRNIVSATTVDFGSNPAQTFTVHGNDSIQAVSPAGTGAVVITVTTPNGTSSGTGTSANEFDYVSGPTIQSVTPHIGATTGGTRVTIAGAGFTDVDSVTFGGVSATFTLDSSQAITAVTPGPEDAGTVPVVVNTDSGSTPPDPTAQYTYTSRAPIVVAVNPPGGPGGTSVTISGKRFEKSRKGGTTVSFGDTPATSVTVVNGKTIMADAPPGSGTVSVTVTDVKGTSNSNVTFTYSSEGS
ncbi:MAG TPA: IPT/TIG domain-containing protein [Acidimicrobiales bacterium]|nr:IPT/TIG domain-containing protein [Acidimicrobiales bacterium]